MKIIIVSDTHVPERAEQLPSGFLDKAAGADLILHAGDLVELSVLEELKKISKVVAVWGNMDPLEVRKALKEKEIVKADGISIGLMHGRGHPNYLIHYLQEAFRNDRVDIIVFGHAHKPSSSRIDSTLFFNPGSLTDTIASDYASYGLIQTQGDKYTATIERL